MKIQLFKRTHTEDEAQPQPWYRHRAVRIVLMCLLGAVFFASSFMLARYGLDLVFSRQGRAQLEAEYDRAVADAQEKADAPRAEAAPTATPQPRASAEPTSSLFLPRRTYRDNPYCIVTDQFLALRRSNPDIVGHLEIKGLLSEIVVQRDDTYYLQRDAYGRHNVNGAIFLDAACQLKSCPYTLILYGHNMRTGEMFGALRNYEKESFYYSNPFITFDTIYEKAEYVIFTVADVSINEKSNRYIDLDKLQSTTRSWRTSALNKLRLLSSHINRIPVQADDQLLLLVTCVGETEDRRIVAARRLREGETKEELLRLLRR